MTKHVPATHESVDCLVASRDRVEMEGKLQRTLGDNLRSYRTARNLSQEAFADVLGMNRTYVGALERGERNLTLKTVERLARQLDLDPLALLARRDV